MRRRPPVRAVFVVVRCDRCGEAFRGLLSWRPPRPVTCLACAWCHRGVPVDPDAGVVAGARCP